MLQQRFWRSLFTGLFAALLVGQSVSIRAKAEQTSYNGLWITENQFNGGSENGTYTYSTVAKIYTNDPSASGTVTVTYRVLGASSDSTADVPYFGYYTEVTLVNNPTQSAGSTNRKTGTFTVSGTNISTQIVELDEDQLQALINQFIAVQDAIDNIDDTIDTISWLSIDNAVFQYSTTWNGQLINSTGNIQQGSIYVNLPVSNDLRRNSTIYHIRLGIDKVNVSQSTILGSLYYISNGGERVDIQGQIYIQQNRQNIDIYIYNMRLYYESNMRIEISISNGNLYVYSTTNAIFEYIKDTDIEYWQLLYYLTALNGQTLVINNQQTVINQQNQNNEYNQQPYDTDTNNEQTDDIEGFMVDYDNKLGFIGQSFDFITSLFGVITNADASSTIPFPGVTVPIGENGANVTLIQAQNVDIVPNGLSNIFEYVRLANSMIIVSAVFNMAINKYKEWSMK